MSWLTYYRSKVQLWYFTFVTGPRLRLFSRNGAEAERSRLLLYERKIECTILAFIENIAFNHPGQEILAWILQHLHESVEVENVYGMIPEGDVPLAIDMLHKVGGVGVTFLI